MTITAPTDARASSGLTDDRMDDKPVLLAVAYLRVSTREQAEREKQALHSILLEKKTFILLMHERRVRSRTDCLNPSGPCYQTPHAVGSFPGLHGSMLPLMPPLERSTWKPFCASTRAAK